MLNVRMKVDDGDYSVSALHALISYGIIFINIF